MLGTEIQYISESCGPGSHVTACFIHTNEPKNEAKLNKRYLLSYNLINTSVSYVIHTKQPKIHFFLQINLSPYFSHFIT